LLLRQESQPRPIRAIAWKTQLRLCVRYRKLARTGKPANIVTTAIARELAGFVWAIARQVPVVAIAVGMRITGRHRVTGGGHPPPVPTKRSVRISRTTLFRR